jgi:hypothetical protein
LFIGLPCSPFELYVGLIAERDGKWPAAFKSFQKAAVKGNGDAMCKLCQFYLYSLGACTVDWYKAEELIGKALELKAADAKLWQGLLQAERVEWIASPAGLRKAIGEP